MLQKFLKTILSLVSLFKSKPKLSDVLAFALSRLPDLIENAINFGGYDTKEKFDDFLFLFDHYTGIEAGAIDLIKDLPLDQEEAFFDHIKEAARIIGYNRLKVAGYHLAD